MERNFKVIKSTESTKGGFVNTIETESTIKIFGVDKTTRNRFLMKTDGVVALGTQQVIDLDEYNQVPRSSELDGRTITSTWLHRKVEAA